MTPPVAELAALAAAAAAVAAVADGLVNKRGAILMAAPVAGPRTSPAAAVVASLLVFVFVAAGDGCGRTADGFTNGLDDDEEDDGFGNLKALPPPPKGDCWAARPGTFTLGFDELDCHRAAY